MSKCKFCGGSYKVSTKEHVLQTRHATRSKMIIENLPVKECNICGYTIIPESSEKIIEMLRQKVRKEMEELAIEAQAPKGPFKQLKKVLRNLIG